MSLEKSNFTAQFVKFKEDGRRLKETQREYEKTVKRLFCERNKGQEKFKNLKMRNDYLQAQINLRKCENSLLDEKLIESKKKANALEKKIYAWKKKLIIAEHIAETEKVVGLENLGLQS